MLRATLVLILPQEGAFVRMNSPCAHLFRCEVPTWSKMTGYCRPGRYYCCKSQNHLIQLVRCNSARQRNRHPNLRWWALTFEQLWFDCKISAASTALPLKLFGQNFGIPILSKYFRFPRVSIPPNQARASWHADGVSFRLHSLLWTPRSGLLSQGCLRDCGLLHTASPSLPSEFYWPCLSGEENPAFFRT